MTMTHSTHAHADNHAIVIGGSMAGLLAARVLSDHFTRVTLVERDPLEGATPRKGVPHGRHAHGLLAQGQRILEQLFPGLGDDLIAAGASSVDLMDDVRWYQPGGYRMRGASDIRGLSLSRPLLEAGIRRRVLAFPNVTVRTAAEVTGLVTSSDGTRVSGAIVARRADAAAPPETLVADLVIDAGGRGSRAPAWLESLGYERPQEERITIGVGYATRLFARRPDDLPGARAVIVQPTPPHQKRIGVLLPVEDERWIVTLGGWLGDHAPTDLDGFRAFARSLPAPDIYDVIKTATPLDDGTVYMFPMNLRRHYERLERVPEGYVVIGDALCSFNPIYGQGMTVCALEARELAVCLREAPSAGGLAGLPRRFYRRAAAVIDLPWQMAAGADFAYPGVGGHKERGTDLLNWYMRQVQGAATRDARTCRRLVAVSNLLAGPSALFTPPVVWQAAREYLSRRPALKGLASVTAADL